MAGTKRTKTFNKKKSTKRGRFGTFKKSAPKRSVVKWKNMAVIGRGFPKKMTITHTYVENLTVSTTSGSQANYVFRCNGMYDPNQTGTGHQPLYFDQMSALYNHYVVIGSKIEVRFTHAAQTNLAQHVMLRIDDDATVPTNTQETMEQNGGKFKVLPAGSPYQVLLKNGWSAKKFFGGSILANTSLQGTPGSDPAELSYYQIAIRPMDGITDATVHMQVKITYIAVWKELKEIASS